MNDRERIQQVESLINQGKLERAKEELEAAQRDFPQNAEIANNLGVVCYLQGDFQSAAGHFLDALRLQPSNADALSNLLQLLQEQGHFKDVLNVLFYVLENGTPEILSTDISAESIKYVIVETILNLLDDSREIPPETPFSKKVARSINQANLQPLTPVHGLLLSLKNLIYTKHLPAARDLISRFQKEYPEELADYIHALLASIAFKLNDRQKAAEHASKIREHPALGDFAQQILKTVQYEHKPSVQQPKRNVLVIIDHRGILKLFVNMLICSPELLHKYHFTFIVSDYYQDAALFGPFDNLKTLAELNRFEIRYDFWEFIRYIDNGDPEKSVVHDRVQLLKNFNTLLQHAAEYFMNAYNMDSYDLVITGLRSQTLIPLLRFSGYWKNIILYPVAPFIYYPSLRPMDNQIIKENAQLYSKNCIHIVASDFYEDMYNTTFPAHPFKLVKIPHGVNPDFYGKWQGDVNKIFWASSGITNADTTQGIIRKWMEEAGYELELFGYLCFENTNKHCNPEGAPEAAVREAMIHCAVAIQYFLSHQMIGYVEKLAVGIPTISLLGAFNCSGQSAFNRKYRSECDFVDKENTVPIINSNNSPALLKAKIDYLMKNPSVRRELSAYLRKVCQERYSFQRYQKQWTDLLNQAVQAPTERIILKI